LNADNQKDDCPYKPPTSYWQRMFTFTRYEAV